MKTLSTVHLRVLLILTLSTILAPEALALAPLSPREQADFAYKLILHRKPTNEERLAAEQRLSTTAPTALRGLCLELAQSKELQSRLEPASPRKRVELLYKELIGREPENKSAWDHDLRAEAYRSLNRSDLANLDERKAKEVRRASEAKMTGQPKN